MGLIFLPLENAAFVVTAVYPETCAVMKTVTINIL